MTLPASYPSATWHTVASISADIALLFRHELRDDAASWNPTDEQERIIERALVDAWEALRQYASDRKIDVAELDTWDVRKEKQFALVLCYLGAEEFFLDDPQASAWPEQFCKKIEDWQATKPTFFGADGVTPLTETETDASERKQPRWSNRNGLRGDAHDRAHDWSAATVTRSGKLPRHTTSSNTLRS